VANGVRRIQFGTADKAEVRATDIRAVNGSISFELHLPGCRGQVVLPLPGRHNVHNALAAAAAAWVLDVSCADIVAGLSGFRPCPGRMELIELPGDIVVLEDSYNANPLSVRAALTALYDLGRPGRRIAVLGDMLELGASAREMHREIGALAAASVDRLLVLGDLASELAAGARAAGLPAAHIFTAADHAELAAALMAMLQPGDRILIKGSRGMRMERVTALLRAPHNGQAAKGA